MPNRPYTPRQRRALIDEVAKRDGFACHECRTVLVWTLNSPQEVTLQHEDHNRWNCRLDNLFLLCRRCNGKDGADFQQAQKGFNGQSSRGVTRAYIYMNGHTTPYRNWDLEARPDEVKKYSDGMLESFLFWAQWWVESQGGRASYSETWRCAAELSRQRSGIIIKPQTAQSYMKHTAVCPVGPLKLCADNPEEVEVRAIAPSKVNGNGHHATNGNGHSNGSAAALGNHSSGLAR